MSGPDPAPAPSDPARVRLDRWLWAARFFRTRALAKAAIEGGRILLLPAQRADAPDAEYGGQKPKPGREVAVGDVLLIRRDETAQTIRILATGERRGSATLARTLYEETAASIEARERERARRLMERAGLAIPAARPDKRARRERLQLRQQADPPARDRHDPEST